MAEERLARTRGRLRIAGACIGILAVLAVCFDLMIVLQFRGDTASLGWWVALTAAHVLQAVGGARMYELRANASASLAALLASIPCVSPFCVAGMPFGLWAMGLLNTPEGHRAFLQRAK